MRRGGGERKEKSEEEEGRGRRLKSRNKIEDKLKVLILIPYVPSDCGNSI